MKKGLSTATMAILILSILAITGSMLIANAGTIGTLTLSNDKFSGEAIIGISLSDADIAETGVNTIGAPSITAESATAAPVTVTMYQTTGGSWFGYLKVTGNMIPAFPPAQDPGSGGIGPGEGTWAGREAVVLDADASGTYTVGDTVITGPTPALALNTVAFAATERFWDMNGDGLVQATETIVEESGGSNANEFEATGDVIVCGPTPPVGATLTNIPSDIEHTDPSNSNVYDATPTDVTTLGASTGEVITIKYSDVDPATTVTVDVTYNTATGALSTDRTSYPLGATIYMSVTDIDMNLDPTVADVVITTNEATCLSYVCV